jgi:hypothetical protein
MPKSTGSSPRGERPKLPKGSPFTLRKDGRLVKKVGRRHVYFGRIEDHAAALRLWNEQQEDLKAGAPLRRRSTAASGPTVADLCNRFLTAKRSRVDSGELSWRTLQNYLRSCATVVETFGRDRLLSTLGPADFESLRVVLARGKKSPRGPVALGNEVRHVRTLFKYAHEADVVPHPIKLGQAFRQPSRSVLRKHRQAHGAKLFIAAEIRAIIAAAPPQLKAMTWLGINAGLGQGDCSSLPVDALDLDGGWIDFPRPKTGAPRRAKLWPETCAAVRDALAVRPDPKDPADAGLVFVTAKGNRWVRAVAAETGAVKDSVAMEFSKLLRKLRIKRFGTTFYTLRRTFRTVADACHDHPAIDLVMGHAEDADDMAARYRQTIDDARLVRVAETVRAWLFREGGAA